MFEKSLRSDLYTVLVGDQTQDGGADKAKTVQEQEVTAGALLPKVAQERREIIVFSKSFLGGNYFLYTQG